MGDFLGLITGAALQVGIVGEWANISDCDSERIVFAATGDYFFLEKKKEKWKPKEEGTWNVENDIVKFGPKNSDNISTLKVSAYTPNSISFCKFNNKNELDCDDVIYVERCGER